MGLRLLAVCGNRECFSTEVRSSPQTEMLPVSDKSKANLKPWRRGVSGNPSGRPRRHPISEWYAAIADEWECCMGRHQHGPCTARLKSARIPSNQSFDRLRCRDCECF